MCIVLEHCPGGDLGGLLKKSEGHTWASAFRTIVIGIARCFKYLHHEVPGESLIHRDLKPANVLIAGDMTPKVAVSSHAK